MTREIIETPDAPRSPLYSQAVKVGDHVHVSGLVGIDVATGALAGESIGEQTRSSKCCSPGQTTSRA